MKFSLETLNSKKQSWFKLVTFGCSQESFRSGLIKNDKIEMFKLLIQPNLVNLNHQDYQGNTLLHYILLYGRRETYVKLLINKGCARKPKRAIGNQKDSIK